MEWHARSEAKYATLGAEAWGQEAATGLTQEQDSQRRHALVNEWNTLVNRLRSNGVHFLVPPSQPEVCAAR
jgi:hypothetical protein